MSYEKKSANETPQEASKPPQFLPLLVIIAVAFGLLALLIRSHPELVILLIVAGIAGYVGWYMAERKRLHREEVARAGGYANVCGPQIIESENPNEGPDEVNARAVEFREKLRLSGNPYAEKIPIIVKPYFPMIYGDGQFTMSWDIYKAYTRELRFTEGQKWVNGACPAELKATYMSQVLKQIQNIEN